MQHLFFRLLVILSANSLFMASATEAAGCSSTQQCAKAAEISRLLKELTEMQKCNETSCAAGWSKFDNNCYKLFPIAGKTFEVADQVCAGYNYGHLASIHSSLEEKFILGLDAKANGIYLGAQKVSGAQVTTAAGQTATTTTTMQPTKATTVASQSCPSGQLWYPRTGACIKQELRLDCRTLNATANWVTRSHSFAAGFTDGCIERITAPAGTTIQLNITSFYLNVCDAGCTVTALQLSDNYGPLSNPLCCSTDVPQSFTFTSNNVLLVIQATTAAIGYFYSYRYIVTPTGQTTTTTTTGSVTSFKWIDGTPFDYTHYASGQPDGDGQFLHLWPSQGGWNDYNWGGGPVVGEPLYFACKYKAVDIKATTAWLQQTIAIMYQQCNPCSSQPCKNGGSCTSSTVDSSYRCNCTDNTRGDNCEVLLECTSTSCSANADCFVQNHQINCVCKSGYTTDENGVCSIKTREACMWGDPHYTTFDGLKYDYQGTCPYVVTQPCDYDISPYFSVRAQNKQLDNFRVSVVTWVELNIAGYSFKVYENLTLTVDGVPVLVPYQHFIPYDPNWKVKAYISAGQMHIVTPEHIEIMFYPVTGTRAIYQPGTLCVTVPETMVSGTGRLCGLFGDVDNKCQNDMRGMKKNLFGVPQDNCVWPVDGPNAMTAERFGDDWIDDFLGGTCIPGTVMTNTSLPCTPAEYVAAKQACQAIEDAKSGRGIFAKCAAMGAAKLDQLLGSCTYDICADKNLRCSALTSFVHTCQQSVPGIKLVDWRTNVQCPLECPVNQYYSDCVSGCQTSCANLTSKAVCNKPCIEGCTCSSGTVLDGTGKNCIPEKSCGCTDSDGNYHEAGSIWMNSDCTKANKCLEFDKLITKDVACGTRGTCSSANKQYQCTCATGSTGTCKTAAETIVNSIEYLLCNCK